jgi:hypothetical protein
MHVMTGSNHAFDFAAAETQHGYWIRNPFGGKRFRASDRGSYP